MRRAAYAPVMPPPAARPARRIALASAAQGLTLALAAPWCALAAQRAETQRALAIAEELPPLSFWVDGMPRGIAVELLEMTCRLAGYELRMQMLPARRAEAQDHDGSIRFPVARLPQLESRYRWLGPIAPRRIRAWRLTSRADILATSMVRLGKFRLGVVRDSAIAKRLLGREAETPLKIEWAHDEATNFRKLVAGRMDVLLMDEIAALWFARRQGMAPAALTPMFTLESEFAYWYALSPNSTDALVARLQNALDSLERDGVGRQVRERYLGA